jgi:anaerobic selenocysteine-containing dehydrogenase
MTVNAKKKVSRREFLKLSGGLASISFLGKQLFRKKENALSMLAGKPQDDTSEWKHAYCSSCIWPDCATLIKVKDGVAVQVKGDPEGPFNKGTLCPRGSAILANLYNPYRVKAPMKRTNPQKGLDVDPGWVEISWDEAFGIVSQKLKEVREKDPRRFAVMTGFSSRMTETKGSLVFNAASGTPNSLGNAGPLCAVHYSPQLHHGTYVDKIDLGFCEYLIAIGRTVGANFMMASGPARGLADALDRGMKFVVIDPRCSTEASKGEWVPIRPGTDMAFGLAMLNVILNEIKQFDVVAVRTRTNGPYLIGADGDYVRDPGSGKPLVWDTVTKTAKVFDDESIQDFAIEGTFQVNGQEVRPAFDLMKEHVKQYTPEWAEKITTIPAATIRRITGEYVAAAHLGATITLDGVVYPYRPVCIAVERGAANHVYGQNFHFLTGAINAIMGASDVPGAMCSVDEGPPWLTPGKDGTVEVTFPGAGAWAHLHHGTEFEYPPNAIDLTTFYPIGHNTTPMVARAYAEPEKYHMPYEIEVLMTYGGNGIVNNASTTEVVEFYKKIPFVFSISYHFDEPTLFSDIVLPEAADLERYQAYNAHHIQAAGKDTFSLHATNFRYPVVEPVYNARQAEDIFIEIALRAGFLFGPGGMNFLWNKMTPLPETHLLALDKRYTYPEIVDVMLRAQYGDDKGIEFFKQKGWMSKQVPLGRAYNYFFNPKTRLEIYARSQMEVGRRLRKNLNAAGMEIVPGWEFMKPEEFFSYYEPLFDYKETSLQNAPDEFDLYVINWKISPRPLGIAGQDDNPWLREVVKDWEHGGLSVHMNKATAARKGLKDGDPITIHSQHGGQVDGRLFTTELIHPEVIGVPGQAGHRSPQMHPVARLGLNYNQLLSSREGNICPTSAGVDISARVKVEKR